MRWNFSLAIKIAGAVAAAAILVTALAPGSFASNLAVKGDSFLSRAAASSGRVHVIVALSGGGSPAEIAQLQGLGGDIYRHLSIIRSVALTLPSKNLDELADLSFVTHISTDLDTQK